MAKKKRHSLGLHTKEEQEDAFALALQVFEDSKDRILNYTDKDALLFALGYLQAIRSLADLEGARELSLKVDHLVGELNKSWHETAR